MLADSGHCKMRMNYYLKSGYDLRDQSRIDLMGIKRENESQV